MLLSDHDGTLPYPMKELKVSEHHRTTMLCVKFKPVSLTIEHAATNCQPY